MRAAVRTKTTNEPQLELFTVNALRIPIYETTHPIRPDGRETLAGVPTQNGNRVRDERSPTRDAADSGGTDREGTRRASPETDSAGSDATTGPRPGLGNGLSAI